MADINNMDVFTQLQIIVASISIVCGGATLWILHDMNKWTGFLWLVATLSIAQMTYDIGFFFRADTSHPTSVFLWYLLQVTGGMATTLVTNVIAFIVANIAITLRSYDIKKNYLLIMSWVMGISLVPAVLLAVTAVIQPHEEYNTLRKFTTYAYASLRVISVFINIGSYIVLQIRLRRMGLSLNNSKNQPVHPVAALSSRMVYYPIVQFITRAAAAWMEFRYPTGGGNDQADDTVLEDSTSYQIANYLYSVSGPSAGIGFFLIFLFMQPAAYSHFKARLFCTNKDQPTASHALKADILRESHSVCINDIDASESDTTSQSSSVDLDNSPLNIGNGRSGVRGFSQDANPSHFGQGGRTRSQGANGGAYVSSRNPYTEFGRGHARPLSTDSNTPFREQYMSDEGVNNNNFFHDSRQGSGQHSKATSHGTSQSYGESFLPSKLALLDDDELAGLVDKLAKFSQQNSDDVNNALVSGQSGLGNQSIQSNHHSNGSGGSGGSGGSSGNNSSYMAVRDRQSPGIDRGSDQN